MKRSPLHRKTPLRTRSPLRRSSKPLRPRSRKRAQEDAKSRGAIEAFRLEFTYCWLCGERDTPWNPLEVHHIAGREHPKRDARANLFRPCRKCHEREFTNRTAPVETVDEERCRHANLLTAVLAYKLAHDPGGYCLETVLQIKGWDADAVDGLTVETLAGLERMRNRRWVV